jgi:ribonuclease HI
MWVIYTDGSASPNPGPGGAGVVILKDDVVIKELIHSGGQTTNNRMELQAVIMALQWTAIKDPVNIFTDSQYVQKGLTEWIPIWKKRNWKKVKNDDLWRQLDQLWTTHQNVQIKWVKAHAGHTWNERADQLANRGTEHSKKSL